MLRVAVFVLTRPSELCRPQNRDRIVAVVGSENFFVFQVQSLGRSCPESSGNPIDDDAEQ